MEILNAEQVRCWDEYTIRNGNISSLDLMERAATACFNWIAAHYLPTSRFRIFCGKGNNGGDGLAIARLLLNNGFDVTVYITEFGKLGSEDFQANLQLLHPISDRIFFIQSQEHFPMLSTEDVVIDALLGTGLNKPLEGMLASLVHHLNHSRTRIISIDLPTGMFSDKRSPPQNCIHAVHTLSFECYKPCFMAAENERMLGELHLLLIGLNQEYLKEIEPQYRLLKLDTIRSIYRRRARAAHKGDFGHVLVAAGSTGKMGAAVLCTSACVHAGAGLTTALVPADGVPILQVAVPEAMTFSSGTETLAGKPEGLEKFTSLAAGPGMGTSEETIRTFSYLLRNFPHPVVIDADAINCLAKDPELLQNIPPGSILTPHPKEFDRFFGTHENEFERWKTAEKESLRHNIIIVLKSFRSLICLPDGRKFFNNTGNPGLAKGGSGDVLTGIIAALAAQGYSPGRAALLGVLLHGLAGDCAASALSEESITASDIISNLHNAFKIISGESEN